MGARINQAVYVSFVSFASLNHINTQIQTDSSLRWFQTSATLSNEQRTKASVQVTLNRTPYFCKMLQFLLKDN